MIAGHADEIGLIVKRIDSQGMIWFGSIGGIDPTVLPGTRVRVLAKGGEVFGLIGAPAIHLLPRGESPKPPKLADLCIDIGATSKREAESLVSVGDPAIFGEDFREMANGFASHRVFDNRVGCWVAAEVLREGGAVRRRKGRPTLYAVSSVQEETGVWGAGLVAYRYMPTVGIAVDVTHDTSTPGLSKSLPEVACGKGPVISRGIRSNRILVDLLERAARAARVPYQIEIDEGSTWTDADAISNKRTGIPVATVSIPCRYMHTPNEVIHLSDLEKAVKLLARFVRDLPEKTSFVPR
jgi:endoglucanase